MPAEALRNGDAEGLIPEREAALAEWERESMTKLKIVLPSELVGDADIDTE